MYTVFKYGLVAVPSEVLFYFILFRVVQHAVIVPLDGLK